ncbi:hypothetical protein F5Y13DRAFT_187749 [Hypoxylon sp. FL1857]|nr:hypothetical protein F5Y13DRAFT_187749 [Hypoxylon sp. FL1857]
MEPQNTQLPPDPRLARGKVAHYNRDEIVSQLDSFYHFLPHIPTSAIHRAPPNGWPSITAEALERRGIHKTAEAIELMRHLPYISLDGGARPWFIPDGFVCDYRLFGRDDLTSRTKPGWMYDVERGSATTVDGDEERWSPWVVQLTAGTDREANCYMLDTTDGTVTRYCVMQCLYDPRYDKGDPRSWRDRLCDDETRTLDGQIEEWQAWYRDWELLALPSYIRTDGIPEDPELFVRRKGDGPGSFRWEETEALQKIYRDHGWPDKYEKEKCHQALIGWWRGGKGCE